MGGGLGRCVRVDAPLRPAAAKFWSAKFIDAICCCKSLMFLLILVLRVEFVSVSCEITVELAANASPKVFTASSMTVSLSSTFSIYAEKLREAACVSVSDFKLYAFCQNVVNSSHVLLAAGSALQSLYSDA